MFGARAHTTHTLFISDTHLRLLSFVEKKGVLSIQHHHEETLPSGIVIEGELMKAEAFRQILSLLKKKFPQIKQIILVLPFEHFEFHALEVGHEHRAYPLKKKMKSTLRELKERPLWMNNYAYEVQNFTTVSDDYLFFECLAHENAAAYEHIIKQAGFTLTQVHADLQLLAQSRGEQRSHIVYVEEHRISVALVDRYMIRHIQSFPFSQKDFIAVVRKYGELDEKMALEVFLRYGFLRSHRSQKVYRKLIELMAPVFFALNQKPYITDVHIVFGKLPYLGFVDMFKKQTKHHIREYDLIAEYLLKEDQVLPLHKREVYPYQSLIAAGIHKKH